MTTKKYLLFRESKLFPDATLLDSIHQSIIDLKFEHTKEQIKDLLDQSLAILDTNLNEREIKETTILISECLTKITIDDAIFNQIYKDIYKNYTRLFSFAMLLVIHKGKLYKNEQTKEFIQNASKQLFQNIKERPNDKFSLSDQDHKNTVAMPVEYKANFISYIILSSQIIPKVVKFFYPYIFHQPNLFCSCKAKLIHRLSTQELLDSIPAELLIEPNIFDKLPPSGLAVLLPQVEKGYFIELLPKIKTIIMHDSSNSDLLQCILDICVNYSIDFNAIKIDNYFEHFHGSMIKAEYWKYFARYNVKLPSHISLELTNFPDDASILKVVSSPNCIPAEYYMKYFQQVDDMTLFEEIAKNKENFTSYEFDVCSNTDFWIHIFLVISNSQKKYSQQLFELLKELFVANVDSDNLFCYFDEMIFTNFSTNNFGYYFLHELLDDFDNDYKDGFKQNLDILLTKISDMEIFPPKPFWLLFDLDYIKNFYNEGNTDPLIICAYSFLSQSNNIQVAKIRSPLSQNSKDAIILFTQTRDMNQLLTSNAELVTFVTTIEVFLNQTQKPLVEGLTEETILPFIAISLCIMEENGGNLLFDSEIDEMFFNKLENLSNDNFDSVLVNLLLKFSKYTFNESLFPSSAAFEMYDIFIYHYMNQTFIGDKSILFESLSFLDVSNLVVQSIYQKSGHRLIKFFLENPSFYTDIGPLRFNLSYFVQDELTEVLQKQLCRRDKLKLSQACSFLSYYCVNIPLIKFKNGTNLQKLLSQYKDVGIDNSKVSYEEEFQIQSDRLLGLAQFIMKSTDNIDKHIEFILNEFMDDFYVSTYYACLILEKVSKLHTINNSDLSTYSAQFGFYFNSFNQVMRQCYSTVNNVLTRNFEHSIADCHMRVTHLAAIHHLLDSIHDNENTFKALYCLNKIALSFPFLFNPNQLNTNPFDIIFPLLDSFSLVYQDTNNHQKKMIALLAQSFLYSISYCVEVLNAFLNYIFSQFSAFTQSQILALTFILVAFVNTEKVIDAFTVYATKYNFTQIATDLLQQDIPSEYHDIYVSNIINILQKYYFRISKEFSQHEFILLCELVDDPSRIPFLLFNNYLTIYPDCLPPLSLNIFLSDTEKNDLYLPTDWFQRYQLSSISNTLNINEFKISSSDFCDSDVFDYYPYNNFFNRYVLIPNWLIDIRKGLFKLTESNKKFIQKIIGQPLHLRSSHLSNTFKPNISTFLIELILKGIIRNESSSISLMDSMLNISSANEAITQYLCKYLASDSYDPESKNGIYSFLQQRTSTNLNNTAITSLMIDYALSPEMINNIEFIEKTLNLLNQTTHQLPAKTTFLVAIYLINKKTQNVDTPKILNICNNIEEKNLINVIPYLEELFESNSDTIEKDLLLKFVTVIPDLLKKKNIVANLLGQYANMRNPTAKDIDTFILLFNEITPNQNEVQAINDVDLSFTSSTSNSNSLYQSHYKENYMIKQIPDTLFQENPTFWIIYDQYSALINSILQKDKSNMSRFKFLSNYPELINFDIRLKAFRDSLQKRRRDGHQLSIHVYRSNILSNSFDQMNHLPTDDWLSHFRVSFEKESGIDCGGLTKEWFSLVTKELFNPNLGLFLLTKNNTYQPNPLSSINEEHISYFRFAGKVVARALIQEECIAAHLTPSFRRQILNQRIRLSDYEDIDTALYNSMKSVLELDDPSILELYFEITEDRFGVPKTIPLKENGENIPVTNENKYEYVSLYINYHLRKAINDQITAFCEGFYSLIPLELISVFTQTELDILICGASTIDVDDMQKYARYSGGYSADHATIKMFYKVISKWDQENLSKLISFVTGSAKVPVNGFKDYIEMGQPFKISYKNDATSLPQAHTCFNTIDLPNYRNEKTMNEKLLWAITECGDFGMA